VDPVAEGGRAGLDATPALARGVVRSPPRARRGVLVLVEPVPGPVVVPAGGPDRQGVRLTGIVLDGTVGGEVLGVVEVLLVGRVVEPLVRERRDREAGGGGDRRRRFDAGDLVGDDQRVSRPGLAGPPAGEPRVLAVVVPARCDLAHALLSPSDPGNEP
jgi:hypothetical protein